MFCVVNTPDCYVFFRPFSANIVQHAFPFFFLEGNQVHVVTTTISDYMNDFETFLVEFWAAKFAYTILEAVILSYIRVILFRKGAQNTPTTPSTPDTPVQKVGFFSSLMRKTAEISQKITNTGK